MVLSVYECEIKQQMIKYYHASLGSHPKRTLIEAANVGLTQRVLRLNISGDQQVCISRICNRNGTHVAETTSHPVNHQQVKTRQIIKKKIHKKSDTASDIADTISLPTQEQDNNKTHLVLMSVKRVEGYVASYQTGKFPRTSDKGMQYICVFYI